MDKMTFASYKFKPSDVVEGLNRYFAETKANRYLRVPLEIRRGVCYNNPDCVKDIMFTNNLHDWSTKSGRVRGNYYLICDPEEVVGVAINWLREEHDIFYTPGTEVPVEDFDVDEAAKEYEKETRTSDIFCEGNLDMVPVAKVREALGIAEDSDILERIRNTRERHDKFRKNAIEDLKNRGFFFRPEENETLPEIYSKLLKRYDDYFSRYKEQFDLRQMWHARYESEHERANGVQKALDREREKCRVKDISLETAKKQYEKVCGNLETAECALNGMKGKVRSLQEEKTKVITALGQDIWDDCVK